MSDAYVHGSSEAERRRLSLMNDLINERCLGELRLRHEMAVVDFGSGLGQFTCAIAASLPEGSRVVGIERDPDQIARARELAVDLRAARVEFRQGDVTHPPLGNEWGRFDLAHARFLLEHHPDPAAIVQNMVTAVRPGGRIVLADDDHELLRLWPDAAAVAMSAWRAYVRLYELHGTDAFVGRRLVSLLHAAGARPLRNTYVFYGACATQPHFEGLVDNLVGVLTGARDAVVQAGLMEPLAYDAGVEALRLWKHLPDAALWYAINWAEGTRTA